MGHKKALLYSTTQEVNTVLSEQTELKVSQSAPMSNGLEQSQVLLVIGGNGVGLSGLDFKSITTNNAADVRQRLTILSHSLIIYLFIYLSKII